MNPQQIVDKVFAGAVAADAAVIPAGGIRVPVVQPYGTKLSEFLTVGVDHLASPDTGECCLLPQMTRLFDELRRIVGVPIPVTAGFRTVHHQESLIAAGYKGVATLISPHSLGAALDLDARERVINGRWIPEVGVNVLIQDAAREAAGQLGYPTPRIGHRAYNERFTHVDLIFFLFAPYTALPHPADWLELDEATRKTLGAAWRPGVEW